MILLILNYAAQGQIINKPGSCQTKTTPTITTCRDNEITKLTTLDTYWEIRSSDILTQVKYYEEQTKTYIPLKNLQKLEQHALEFKLKNATPK